MYKSILEKFQEVLSLLKLRNDLELINKILEIEKDFLSLISSLMNLKIEIDTFFRKLNWSNIANLNEIDLKILNEIRKCIDLDILVQKLNIDPELITLSLNKLKKYHYLDVKFYNRDGTIKIILCSSN